MSTPGPPARQEGLTPYQTSAQVLDLALVEVVARGDDLELPVLDQVRQDRTSGRQPSSRAPGALANGVVDEITGLALHGGRSRHDRLDHRADRARQLGVLGRDLAGRHHRAAALVA